jgi:putative nucleotidyltransferase-like protein
MDVSRRGYRVRNMHASVPLIPLFSVMIARRGTATKPKRRPADVHLKSVAALQNAGIPFLVGGAYVVEVYTGVSRRTKDFDVYMRPSDVDAALDVLARAGYDTEVTSPHWLAKAKRGRDYIDLIFRAGNGLCEVDDSWFKRAHDHDLLGLHVKLCAPEEMIWMKAYIMERERFDGADIAHLLLSCADKIDWPHLIARFGPDWRVLLSHLVLFGYIYPSEKGRIPMTVMKQLIERLRSEGPVVGGKRVCRGTLLSRQQYLVDVQQWGFEDARLEDRVHMGPEDIAEWTEAAPKDEQPQNSRA